MAEDKAVRRKERQKMKERLCSRRLEMDDMGGSLKVTMSSRACDNERMGAIKVVAVNTTMPGGKAGNDGREVR